MLHLANDHLTVDLLDPHGDHPCLGGRYCHGGYIWQVRDAEGRDLCAGPEYPETTPSAFNGQGLPEVFRPTNKREASLLTQHEDGRGLIIGIGQVSGGFTPKDVVIDQRLQWTIDVGQDRIVFTCEDAVAPWDYALEREILLAGSVLTSRSTLTNRGEEPLALEWYCHPFFAHDSRGRTSCRFHHPLRSAGHQGYALREDTLFMRDDADWDQKGHFHWLQTDPEQALDVTLSHPLREHLRLTADFPIHCMPVWANSNTLSLEPYLRRDLAPGESYTWSLRFAFGDQSEPGHQHAIGEAPERR